MAAVAQREASEFEIEDAGRDSGGRIRRRPRRAMGLFKHPPDFTDEEFALIVDALKSNMPIYRIAKYVNCERHMLGRFIDQNPDLRQLKEEQEENLFEEGKYQLGRLMQQGNVSAVIYALDKLGQKRGWSGENGGGGGGERSARIVMGLIPDEEVAAADEEVKKRRAELPPMTVAGVEVNDPGAMMAQLEMAADPHALAAQEEQKRQQAEAEAKARAATAKEITPAFVSGALGSREAIMNGASQAAEPEVMMPDGYGGDFAGIGGGEDFDPSTYFG